MKALFLLMAALPLAAAEPRGPLNQSTPDWLTLGFQMRYRSEGQHGVGFIDGNDQDFLLQRYRFSIGIRPAEWLQFYGELQDARSFWLPQSDPTVRDTFDLRQAYVDLGKEGGWWDLKVGRQKMLFGSERLIGAAEWGNVPRVFDAARLAIHHGADRVDLFASSVVLSDMDDWDHHRQGNNLYGAYASIGSLIKGSRIEPYYLFRVAPTFGGEFGHSVAHYDSSTYGVRAAGAVTKPWTYETELIGQRGWIGTSHLKSWAFLGQVNRRFDSLPWTPTIASEFNYAQGDRHQGDGAINTFDQLYPTNHLIYGVTDQQGRRNAENVRAGLKLQPRKWLTLRAEQRWLWLASAQDGLYAFNGVLTVAPVAGGAKYRDVGHEFALIGDFAKSRYYNIGMQWGYLTPGKFLQTYSPGAGRMFYAFYLDLKL